MRSPRKQGVALIVLWQAVVVWRVANDAVSSRENVVKTYEKPVLVQLGNMDLIKSNHTGPSSDGKKYAGFFK